MYSTNASIAETTAPEIYQTERLSTANQGVFIYSLPVANGQYRVVLGSAEIYWTSTGKRVFDVTLEGVKVLDNYDIFRKAGTCVATTETFSTTVADGVLRLDFSALPSNDGVDRPKISAIEVLSLSNPLNVATAAVKGNALAPVVAKPGALGPARTRSVGIHPGVVDRSGNGQRPVADGPAGGHAWF